MQTLSKSTKLKLIMPILYWAATSTLFLMLFSGGTHQWIGITITNIAFVFWIIARVQLGNAFSIAPKTNFLVTTGLYSKLRHPVYYFSILALMGVCIFVGNPLLIIAIFALVLLEWFRIQKEEALLAKQFGKDYAAYKKQTWF